MLRRLPSVAVALVVALGLAACGSDNSGDVSVPSAPTSTPTTQTAPPATQTTVPPTPTTDTGTSGGTPGTTKTDDSGGTSAPGTDEQQSPNERFKKYCEENPNACGE